MVIASLENFFKLKENGTNVRTELLAGLTTFLTMAYIIFVNPAILADAGMPKGAVFVATCLIAALGSLIMGLYANYPIGVAPGMGLNAYFAYTMVKGMGLSWEAALGAVFISGCLFLGVTLLRLREVLINSIPRSMRSAITAGIGLFLGVIALQHAGIMAADPVTFVTLGDLHKSSVLLAAMGFFLIVALDYLKVKGAILIGIIIITVLSFFIGNNQFAGIIALPPSIEPTFFKLDIMGALPLGILNVVLVLFLAEVFDASGTLIGVANRAGLLVDGKMKRLNRALIADGSAIVAGSFLGTSSATAYVESVAGIQAGGRTGLTAVAIALLFLACLFLAPLAGAVPTYATAPALFYIACLMVRDLTALDWDDATESIPAVMTAVIMPFTYSIANGIAFGFITYAGLKLFTGRVKQVSITIWIIAALFLFKFAYLGA
jgi:AGZA family xanthine/uracil permease-like MFS transporter